MDIILERELDFPSIFKDESKISIDYIPEKLLHREMEFSRLSHFFNTLFQKPYKISQKILITGRNGIGKTAVTKRFGEFIKKSAQKKKLKLEYIHINCRIEKSAYQILIQIIRKLKFKISQRGFSFNELLKFLISEIENKKIILILTLDEIDSLHKKDFKLLYYLLKINDDKINPKQHISIISIARDSKFIQNFDSDLKSIFLPHKIRFHSYTKEQIFNILKARVDEAFYKELISDEIIMNIAKISTAKKDIRFALDLFRKVGKIADIKRSLKIYPEYIKQALYLS